MSTAAAAIDPAKQATYNAVACRCCDGQASCSLIRRACTARCRPNLHPPRGQARPGSPQVLRGLCHDRVQNGRTHWRWRLRWLLPSCREEILLADLLRWQDQHQVLLPPTVRRQCDHGDQGQGHWLRLHQATTSLCTRCPARSVARPLSTQSTHHTLRSSLDSRRVPALHKDTPRLMAPRLSRFQCSVTSQFPNSPRHRTWHKCCWLLDFLRTSLLPTACTTRMLPTTSATMHAHASQAPSR